MPKALQAISTAACRTRSYSEKNVPGFNTTLSLWLCYAMAFLTLRGTWLLAVYSYYYSYYSWPLGFQFEILLPQMNRAILHHGGYCSLLYWLLSYSHIAADTSKALKHDSAAWLLCSTSTHRFAAPSSFWSLNTMLLQIQSLTEAKNSCLPASGMLRSHIICKQDPPVYVCGWICSLELWALVTLALRDHRSFSLISW